MKIGFSNINTEIENIDLFICSSGFEARSKSIALAINPEKIRNAFIFNVEENYVVSEENLKEIQNHLHHMIKIDHPRNNPLETYDIFKNKLDEFYNKFDNERLRIVIDITSFTRENLLILLKVIYILPYNKVEKDIKLVYTPADNYSSEWLTKGVRQIRSIFGYSGMIQPSKKQLLIILNGFEEERTSEIIKSFEPNMILLGKPSEKTSINETLDIRGKQSFEKIQEKYTNIKETFEFSCIDVQETIKKIEEFISEYGEEYNIILSPLNNKISTIAVAIVALNNDDVQVCYASANQYNIDSYSIPSDYLLMFDFLQLVNHN